MCDHGARVGFRVQATASVTARVRARVMASRHLGRGHRGHGWLGSESGAARDPAGGGVGVRERGRRVHGRHRRVAHAGHDVRDGAVVRGPALVRVDRALQSVAEVVGGRRRVSCRWCEDGQPAGRKARLRPRGQPQGLREQELRADEGKPHRELGRDQEVAAGAAIQLRRGANGRRSRPRVSPRSKATLLVRARKWRSRSASTAT